MSNDTIKSLTASALAACFAESTTLPLDTAKVRLQLQNRRAGGASHSGVLSTVYNIAAKEGPSALFKGLEAGVHRQLIFSGLRIGLYSDIIKALNGGRSAEEAGLAVRVGAALTTSAIGITVANPSDVVKVRTQAYANAAAAKPDAGPQRTATSQAASTSKHAAESSMGKRTFENGLLAKERGDNTQRRAMSGGVRAAVSMEALYKGPALGVYAHIARTEGVFGGWYAGYTPNLIRNSIISASELVSYDTSKRFLKESGVSDGPLLHMTCGVFAGFVATALGSPMDVVSTRIMVQRAHGYKAGMVETCREMFLKEGIFSFYQGCIPNFARIGSFNVVLWMSFEQLHRLIAPSDH